MTNRAPFPLDVGLWCSTTRHLTAAQRAALLNLLLELWQREGPGLPDDDRVLARIARVTPQQWHRSIKEPVLGMLHRNDWGLWYSPQVARDLAMRRRRRQRARGER